MSWRTAISLPPVYGLLLATVAACAQFDSQGSAAGFLLVGSGSGGGSAAGCAGDWWDCSWTRRRTLTFNNSTRAENLDDFPVLIKLDSSRIDYAQVSAAGEDLRFIDTDGAQLSHEIEKWNSAGDSSVWVKVPRIDAGSPTDLIYLYYGNAAAADGQSASTVWSSSYSGVWHFGETVTDEATTGTHADSTGNGNTASQNGNVNATGQIGDGQDFDGNDNVCAAHSTSLNLTGALTMSAWINPNGSPASYRVLMGKNFMTSYAFAIGGAANTYALALNNTIIADNAGTLAPFTWQQIAWTYTAAGVYTLYVDGVNVTSATNLVAITGSTDQACIASASNNSRYFTGTMDEVRIAGTARSADWIGAQYASMNDSLVTFGSEESQ